MRSKTVNQDFKSTVLPYQNNSCRNCWNRPTTHADDELAPRRHGIYVSLPVYLGWGGKYALICHRAECPTCGDIRQDGPFRLTGGGVDYACEYWQELRQYGIDPRGFIMAVRTQKSRYFEVSKLPKYQSERHRAEFYEPATHYEETQLAF